jgi:hypothetical protein
MALNFMTNIFCIMVLMQSELAGQLPDKQALNEFIAFRKKYMNFPVDKQIADLKRVGIVKKVYRRWYRLTPNERGELEEEIDDEIER